MLTHFDITQCGEKHIEKNLPCQDCSCSCRIYSESLKHDIVIASVADGVGSCELSQDGSKMAVESCVQYIVDALKNLKKHFKLTEFPFHKLLKCAFEHALSRVEKLSEEMEIPFMEFDSTLTTAIYDGENLWFGHIGDDGIVVLYSDGTYEMITTRHKGEEAHSVLPLRDQESWEFGVSSKTVASFVLMTDGVLDYCVDSKAMGSRVYFPFLEPALTTVMKNDKQAGVQKKEWSEYFKGSDDYQDKFRTHVTDDITFVVVQNAKLVKNLPEIEFDFDRWEEETQKRKKEIDDNLYAEFRRYKAAQMQTGAEKSDDEVIVDTVSPVSDSDSAHDQETRASSQTYSSSTPTASQMNASESEAGLGGSFVETVSDVVSLANQIGKKIRKQIDEIGGSKGKRNGNVKKVEQSPNDDSEV